jgi:GT2 family glycosyltransferase
LFVSPQVSVIIITRNRPAILEDCLKHLERQREDGIEFETIVVDSSDTEETQQVLRTHFEIKKARIPGGRDNMPEARNRGMELARGAIYAFIDDDCFVQPGWLRLLAAHYQDASVGGVGGRLRDDRIPPEASYEIVGRIDPDGRVHLNFQRDTGKAVEVDHLPGGNMSFRAGILRKIGGFDTLYGGPNFMEETDLCVRVRAAGYRLIFEPAAVVNHVNAPREGMTRSNDDPRVVYWSIRNRSYFTLKNFPLVWERFRHVFLGSVKLHGALVLERPEWLRLRSMLLHIAGLLSGIVVYAYARISSGE